MSTPASQNNHTVLESATVPQPSSSNDCLTCRVTGSGALAATGIYAFRMSRPSAPGSIAGKRIMAGLGVCEMHVSSLVGLRADASLEFRFFGGEYAAVANVKHICYFVPPRCGCSSESVNSPVYRVIRYMYSCYLHAP